MIGFLEKIKSSSNKLTDEQVMNKVNETLKKLKEIYKSNKVIFLNSKIKLINILMPAFDKATNYRFINLGYVLRRRQKGLLCKYFSMNLDADILINEFKKACDDFKKFHIDSINKLNNNKNNLKKDIREANASALARGSIRDTSLENNNLLLSEDNSSDYNSDDDIGKIFILDDVNPSDNVKIVVSFKSYHEEDNSSYDEEEED